MDQCTHDIRKQQWAKMIQQCNSSGLTKREWCRQNGISTKTFYYRQKQLRNEAYCALAGKAQPEQVPSTQVEFAEIELPSSESLSMETVSEFHPDAGIRTCTMTVEVSSHASKEILRLIRALINHAS